MSYEVYVLLSEKDGSRYVGSTGNLDSRLQQHNKGRSRATKAHRPWRVIHQEEFLSRSSAVKRERFLKAGAGRRELKKILAGSVE